MKGLELDNRGKVSGNGTQSRSIRSDADIVAARHLGRVMAEASGFSRPDQALIATAISELTRNVVKYAGSGLIELTPVTGPGQVGLIIVVRDRGPGIEDVDAAMSDGFSTGGSMGLGLPGTKRIMDSFELESRMGEGVTITVAKWNQR